MFTLYYDREYNTVSLIFKNEILEIDCSPECLKCLYDDGEDIYSYDSTPSNGEFRFHYDDKNITFNAAKYGDGQGGCLTLVLKMTKDIRKSLDEAINEWKEVILKNKDEDEDEDEDKDEDEDEDEDDDDDDENDE